MSLSVPASLLREGANELALTNVADTGVVSLVFLDRFSAPLPAAARRSRAGPSRGRWAESGTATSRGRRRRRSPCSTSTRRRPRALAHAATRPRRGVAALPRRGRTPLPRRLGRRCSRRASRRPSPPRLRATHEPGRLRPDRSAGPSSRPRSRSSSAGRTRASRPAPSPSRRSPTSSATASPPPRRSRASSPSPSSRGRVPRRATCCCSATRATTRGTSTARSQPSPLPALWTKTSYLWTASDPALAAVNGDDALPDLAIGRLPATTRRAGAGARRRSSSPGRTRARASTAPAALVADNPDLAGDFEADVARHRAELPREPQARGCSRSRELGAATRPRDPRRLELGPELLELRRPRRGRGLGEREHLELLGRAEPRRPSRTQPLLADDELPQRLLRRARPSTRSRSRCSRPRAAARSPPSRRAACRLDGPAHQYHRALMAELTSGTARAARRRDPRRAEGLRRRRA